MAQEFDLSAIFKVVNQASGPLRRIKNDFSTMRPGIKRLGDDFMALNRGSAKFFAGLGRWTKRSVIALTAFGAASTYALLRYSKMADTIGKTADKLGISTSKLQEWRFAAEQSGLTAEQLDVSMRFFNKGIGEAQRGTGEAIQGFEELKIGLKDTNGQFKANEALMAEVADKLAKMENAEKKAFVATRLFGRSGADMLNMFRRGGAGLEAWGKQVRDMGGIVPEDTIRQSERLNDNINLLKKSFVGLAGVGVLPILSAMDEIVVRMQRYIKANKDIIAGKLVDWSTSFAGKLPGMADNMTRLAEETAIFVGWINSLNIPEELMTFAKWAVQPFEGIRKARANLDARESAVRVENIGWSGFVESLKEGMRGGKSEVTIKVQAEPGTSATVRDMKSSGDQLVHVQNMALLGVM